MAHCQPLLVSSIGSSLCVGEPIVSPAGRVLCRHSSGAGTVIQYTRHSEPKAIFVADAAYRVLMTEQSASSPMYMGGDTYPPPTVSDPSKYTSGFSCYLSGWPSASSFAKFTDSVIDSSAYCNERCDDVTAKELSDLYLYWHARSCSYGHDPCTTGTAGCGTPFLDYCRSLPWFPDGCDIPQKIQIFVLWAEMDLINRMDPTAAANPTRAIRTSSNMSGSIVTSVFNTYPDLENLMAYCDILSNGTIRMSMVDMCGSPPDMLPCGKSAGYTNYQLGIPIKEL